LENSDYVINTVLWGTTSNLTNFSCIRNDVLYINYVAKAQDWRKLQIQSNKG